MMTYEFFAKQYDRVLKGARARELEDALPGLRARLATALELSKSHWTDSTPVDENARRDLLPPELFDALMIPVRESSGVRHVPAGLMHSYGYLFSQVPTPYGLKGKRWIESRLDERLGLAAGTFSPFTTQGEFLANVTSAFFKVIGVKQNVAGAAALKPMARLSGTIAERVIWKDASGTEQTWDVRTHLVDLKPLAGQRAVETSEDARLLIYEIVTGGRHRLVTGFPVSASAASELMRQGPAADTAFRPRYNLFVDPGWRVVEHRSEGFSASAD